ncbi:hypothetical protein J1614_003735 [Plenodomus biglobosus]|nr:hypothetical protein J1614_003735 [Plenodomus biglobosus]
MGREHTSSREGFESPQPNHRRELTPQFPPPPPSRQEQMSSADPTLEEHPHITETAYKTRPSHTMMISSSSNKHLKSHTVKAATKQCHQSPVLKSPGLVPHNPRYPPNHDFTAAELAIPPVPHAQHAFAAGPEGVFNAFGAPRDVSVSSDGGGPNDDVVEGHDVANNHNHPNPNNHNNNEEKSPITYGSAPIPHHAPLSSSPPSPYQSQRHTRAGAGEGAEAGAGEGAGASVEGGDGGVSGAGESGEEGSGSLGRRGGKLRMIGSFCVRKLIFR